ncbi:MAG: hypothetical protein R3C11_05035 [Planctomycetaceae bacterium]
MADARGVCVVNYGIEFDHVVYRQEETPGCFDDLEINFFRENSSF